MLNIISLGAGVQSSTMALMAAHGEFDVMPDCAIFADTQAEPKEVYVWLDWLEKELPFPVHRVTNGSLTTESLKVRTSNKSGNIYVTPLIPAFMREGVNIGLMGRQCTQGYKIKPVEQKTKELLGYKKGQRMPKEILIDSWVGISLDEAHRMKPSQNKWKKNVYPLIEKNMTRGHCLEWMQNKGYPTPPRSACVYCPFHSDTEWERIKNTDIDGFNLSVKYEKDLQKAVAKDPILKSVPYLHNSCIPLEQVKFDVNNSLDLFGNECSGLCGV